MHRKLPKEIDPYRMAQNGLQIAGEISIASMPRLCEALLNDQGTVTADLKFDVDEIGTPYMKGVLKTDVVLQCERCLSPMTLPMAVDCSLGMVISESKIASLAEQYEPWLLESSDPIELSTVIEDELILALPLVPRHETPCLPSEAWTSGQEHEEEEADKPESPFAVLSSLKNKQ